jgi:hypothetical protein
MVIEAKFASRCKKCGGEIAIGDQINWERGHGASHVKCPENAIPQPAADLFRVGLGEGYGGRPYTVGQIVKRREGGYGVVVRATKQYYAEDGMSFGVGDERGYVFSAQCRPATAEETASEEAKAEAIVAKKAAREATAKRIAEIRSLIQAGERPSGTNNLPEGDRVLDTQTIYGGGAWFVVGPEWIWFCKNNGGDDWSLNNVRTQGAGAIGWRITADPAIAAELRDLAAITKE